jgi:hypothetical protein
LCVTLKKTNVKKKKKNQYPLKNYHENIQVYTHLLNHSGEKCPHLKLQHCFHLNESIFMLVVQTGKDRSIKYQGGDSISVMDIKKPVIVSKNSSTEPSSGQFPVKTKILASVILEHKGLVFAMDSSNKVIVSSNGNMEAGPLSVVEIPQNVRKRMSSLYQVFIPHYVDNKSCQGTLHILR